jgi:hypothetical protein
MMRGASRTDWVLFALSGSAVALLLLTLVGILVPVFVEGLPRIDLVFLTAQPSADLVGGGIWPAIFGTTLLTLLMTLAVVPAGVATATRQSGQCCVPSLEKRSRRNWWISVTVATVDLPPPRVMRCSMATLGGSPSIRSTSGFSNCSTNWRA